MRTTERQSHPDRTTRRRTSCTLRTRTNQNLRASWAVTLIVFVLAGGFAAADVANAVAHKTSAATPSPSAKAAAEEAAAAKQAAAKQAAAKQAAAKLAAAKAASSAPVAATVQAVPPLQVLTIGDSIMKGFGLDPSEAWPELLAAEDDWQLTTLATNGSGFITEGTGGNTYNDLVVSAASLHPDLIVIEGSSNDFGQSNDELAATTTSTVALLRQEFPATKIIGLSTIWSETTPPSQTADIDAQVKSAVTAVGGSFLDLGQPLGGQAALMQGDDVHPTAAGQVVLSGAIQSAVQAQLLSDREAAVAAALSDAPGHL